MPGLNQLKKFSEDITPIGQEETIRREQGTTLPQVDFPADLSDKDDTYDFEFGLPEKDDVVADKDTDSVETGDSDTTNELPLPQGNEPSETGADSGISADLDPEIAALLGNLAPNTENENVPPTETVAPDITLPPELAVPDTDTDVISDVEELSPLETDPLADLSLQEDLSLDTLEDEDMLQAMPSPDIDDFGAFSDNSNTTESFDMGDDSTILGTEDDMQEQTDSDAIFDLDTDDISPLDNAVPDSNPLELNSEDDPLASFNIGVDEENLDTGVDFSDVEVPDVDFSLDSPDFDENDFEIPGFSDRGAAEANSSIGMLSKKKKIEDSPEDRTHLTDSEYKIFEKNLETYPLNVRIALGDFIVNNDFTDEAIMEVLFKVIKKIPARQLAAHLEKLLDISISVPSNYERRTAEQYAAYKLSLEYQLKNRVLPIALATLALSIIGYILFYFVFTFIYKPLRAEGLYKQGYVLIGEDLFQQSETKFNEALQYKVKKRWFFKYARAYRDKKQYSRARIMYEQLVKRFNFDKKGAMEYALMEFEDLANYEKASFIVRRYILDHHINDKDAMLLHGDINLEWASLPDLSSELKAEKFEQARLEYASLMQLYGSNDLYLSRMLRYFIRTDNLREVLPLKSYFMDMRKTTLGATDLVELGGYMLEKQYGVLSPADEYLRAYIDKVKELLEKGVAADPTIPEAHYNLARYFIRAKEGVLAKKALKNALRTFDVAKKRTPQRILRHINTYNLLGEQYALTRDYLLAEKEYAQGIILFENEKKFSELKADKQVGKLYSNMADLDYFISGDLSAALQNYKNAIENFYDTASIRYRIGFIQYDSANYAEALGSFIKTASKENNDKNLLLSLGNVLMLRNDDAAATGYYSRLIDILDLAKSRYDILLPQVNKEQGDLVNLYMLASNNLGVSLARLAQRTGDSHLQGEAMVQFSQSLRAWDALTRNQDTMVRLEGSNLAAQNIRYLNQANSSFDPAIYATIPRTLYGEHILKQALVE